MLSEQAKAALERLHNDSISVVRRADMHSILRDYELIREALMGMCPVHTLNGMVIRWDDEITPERLIASGFMDDDTGNYRHHKIMFSPRHGFYERVSETHTAADSDEYDYPLGECVQPTNMGEVWQLMAKCGCPVGGVE